jgi:hypothetical protein
MILIYFVNETLSKIETLESFSARTQGLNIATGLCRHFGAVSKVSTHRRLLKAVVKAESCRHCEF